MYLMQTQEPKQTRTSMNKRMSMNESWMSMNKVWTKPNKHQRARAQTAGQVRTRASEYEWGLSKWMAGQAWMRAGAWTGCPNERQDHHSRDRGRGGVAAGATNGGTSTPVHKQGLSKRMGGRTMSYFEIVFSVVHRFYINILLNCAVAGHDLVFRMGAEMFIVPVIGLGRTEKRSAGDRPINLRRSPVLSWKDHQKVSFKGRLPIWSCFRKI